MASVTDFSVNPLALAFEGNTVRFVGTADKPEWVAKDVCDVLGIVDSRVAVRDFDDDEKGECETRTLGGTQKIATVYEPGLYRLVMRSNKPAAKAFRKWVFGEVLPSIRQHGVYPPPENFAYQITGKPYTARIVWVMQVRQSIPKGFWCVFIEGADIMLSVEHIFGPANLEMKAYDLLDGSIGKMWVRYRQDKPWMGCRMTYPYTFPKGDPRGTVTPWCYPMQELAHFKEWLHGEYWTQHFPKYVKTKYSAAEFTRAIPLFASVGIPIAAPQSKRMN